MIRLGINLDHIATVRQARGESYPDPVQAAILAELGGAANITCHLREDRRHIQDHDVRRLKESTQLPLNFEMAATPAMLEFALKIRPHAVTLVPEKREELTTEGGLAVHKQFANLQQTTAALTAAGIVVSLFIEAEAEAIAASQEVGAAAVEFHTGPFCRAMAQAQRTREQWALVTPLQEAAEQAHKRGLQVHLGHGLNYQNAYWLQAIPYAEEANIGHAVIAQALFVGLEKAVAQMWALLNQPAYYPKKELNY